MSQLLRIRYLRILNKLLIFLSRVIASVHLEVARPPSDMCNVDTHMDIAKQIKVIYEIL